MRDTRAMLARGLSLAREGRFAEAERLLGTVVRHRPRDASALQALAVAQARGGRYEEALRTLERVRKLAPDHVEPLIERALVLRVTGRFEEAVRAADEACRMASDDPRCAAAKAEALHMLGDVEGAWRVLEGLRERGRLTGAGVPALAEVARLRGEPEAAIEPLREYVADPSLSRFERRAGLFQLGATLDAAGRHDEAFETVSEAQAMTPVRHDRRAFRAAVEEMIGKWTREAISALPGARGAGEAAVLVVGMPRSGTTLVEQIVASHPRGAGAGELGNVPRLARELGTTREGVALVMDPGMVRRAPLERASRVYARALREAGAGAARVVDKNPVNCLHLGLASRLAPGARVIWCVRHPLDTCVSCWFQNFAGQLAWAHDLRSLGAYLRACERVMWHWREVVDPAVLEVRYEALVSDQEGWTRRILEFLGLEWDEACLRFWESGRAAATASNAQVRRPIYASSVERWRRYERHLGPLLEELGLDGAGPGS